MKEDSVYLLHIRDAIFNVQRYSGKGKKAFFEDSMSRDAIVRNLEIIGEATKNISKRLKEKYPKVAWKRIAGMRDKIAHEYFGLNFELIWEVVEQKLPEFQEQIEAMLADKNGS